MPTGTVRLHRVLRAAPERVYRAFLDPYAMAKWLPPHGFAGKVHHIDARAGGGYRMSFTNFGTGKSHTFDGKYIELTPHERIRYTDQFEDPNLPGEIRLQSRSTRLPAVPNSRSFRKGFRQPFRSSFATSGGRSRCRCSPISSNRRFQMVRSCLLAWRLARFSSMDTRWRAIRAMNGWAARRQACGPTWP